MSSTIERSDDEPVSILLVEDNPGDVRLTREAFESADIDTTIHAVADGDDALEFLSERAGSDRFPYPDLVLLDLNLRQMHGFEVLDAMEDDPELSRIPVLVLTSSEATEDVLRSYELAANAYLTKPSSPGDFVSLVQAVEEFWVGNARLPPVPS